jgi:hypothetical protein
MDLVSIYMLRKKNFGAATVTPHNRAGFISTTHIISKRERRGTALRPYTAFLENITGILMIFFLEDWVRGFFASRVCQAKLVSFSR